MPSLIQVFSTCTCIFFEITKKTLWIRDPDPQSMRIPDPDSGSQKPADPCGSGSGSRSRSTSLLFTTPKPCLTQNEYGFRKWHNETWGGIL